MGRAIEFTLEDITPEQAKEMVRLDKTRNRQLNKNVVNCLAEDMKSGLWRTTGEPIIINGGTDVLNGQHRLHACIKANVPFTTAIVRGVSTEAMASMDTGYKRSFGHVLGMRDVTYASTVAAICGWLYRLKMQDAAKARISTGKMLEIFNKHQRKIVPAAALLYEVPRSPVLGTGILGTLLVARPEQGEKFLSVLRHGVPAYKGCPVHLLREDLLRLRQRKTVPNSYVQAWTTVAVFNLFNERIPLDKIAWTKEPVGIDGFNHKTL